MQSIHSFLGGIGGGIGSGTGGWTGVFIVTWGEVFSRLLPQALVSQIMPSMIQTSSPTIAAEHKPNLISIM